MDTKIHNHFLVYCWFLSHFDMETYEQGTNRRWQIYTGSYKLQTQDWYDWYDLVGLSPEATSTDITRRRMLIRNALNCSNGYSDQRILMQWTDLNTIFGVLENDTLRREYNEYRTVAMRCYQHWTV